jgi:2-oxoglutarate dehydrogenase E2 component (dihydrolipoamide succinyltransferase)
VQEGAGEAAANGAVVMPAAQRLLAENNLNAGDVTASGPGGRVLKEDVINHVEGKAGNAGAAPIREGAVEPSQIEHPAPAQPDGKAAQETRAPAPTTPAPTSTQPPASSPQPQQGDEEVVPMSMLRRHVAQRLVEAQQNAALLTTFNEIDMSNVMAMRKEYQDAFTKKYGISWASCRSSSRRPLTRSSKRRASTLRFAAKTSSTKTTTTSASLLAAAKAW